MLPEINSIFKILQKTSAKKNNQPTPNDPKVEYNNIFLKLITVSKVGSIPNNNRYEKTRNKNNISSRFDISPIESFSNSNNYERQILPNVYYVNNGNRFPLSISIKKLSDPIYHENYLNNQRLKENHKNLKKNLLNIEDSYFNNNHSLEKHKNKNHYPERFKNNKKEFDALNFLRCENFKSNELPDLFNRINDNSNSSIQKNHEKNNNEKINNEKNNNEKINEGKINNEKNNNEKINIEKINIEKINNENINTEINKDNNENNKETIINNISKYKSIRSFNFLKKIKQKNNDTEENKTIISNIVNTPIKKLVDFPKKIISSQKEFKRIKTNIHEKQSSLQILETLKNNFSTEEKIRRKLNYKLIPFPLNQNINNPTNQFYYYINKMYRDQLVDYFDHRINWECVYSLNDPDYPNINFYWKYYSNKLNYKQFKHDSSLPMKKLKVINLFQRNYEIGNKKNLFINLVQYCDKMNINVFEIVPFTIIIPTSRINECFEAFYEVYQLIHSNTNNYCNSDKDLIANKKYNELFSFDKNYSELKNTPIFINKYFLSEKNYWLLKPTDLYKGMCIEISNNYDEIVKQGKKMFKGVDKKFLIENIEEENEIIEEEEMKNNTNNNTINKSNINTLTISRNNNNDNESEDEIEEDKKKKKGNSMYISNTIVLQKYLDNPLLYNKRKFDIRCYVLVDSNLNVFFCREGHLKGSSEKYDLNNTNKFIHITNYSLQKKSNKFEKYEYGNEISFKDFKLFLEKENISLDNFDNLINDMKYLIKISMNSVGKKLFKTENVLCFEVFGYDFIVDNNFKPWILEINNNPGLGISSPVIEKLVPRMFDDALRLTIDKIFDTKYHDSCFDKDNNLYISKYKLEGFSDDENVFEFLCNVSN